MPPVEVNKTELLEALGMTKAQVSKASSLDTTTKILSALDKPIVNKYLDRILGRVIKPDPEPGQVVAQQPTHPPGAPTDDAPQPAPEPAQAPAPDPQPEPKPEGKDPEKKGKEPTGVEVVGMLQTFLVMQDDKITIGEFQAWLDENKEKLGHAIDMGRKHKDKLM